MRIFRKYARLHARAIALALVFLAFTDLAQVLVPNYVQDIFNAISSTDRERAHLYRAVAVIFGLVIITAVFRMAWRLVMWPTARTVEYELRGEYFGHLRRLDPSWFHDHPPGDLMSRATSDIDAVRELFSMGFVVFFDAGLLMPLALAMMMRQDWKLTLLVAPPILAAPLLSFALMHRIERMARAAQDRLGDLTGRVEEDVTGVRVIKSYAREDAAAGRFGALNRDVRDINVRLWRLISLIDPYFHLVPNISIMILVMAGSAWALRGQCSLGELVAFEWYLGLLTWPTFALGWGITMLQRGRASAARIEEVLAAPPRQRAPEGAGPPEVRGDIAVRQLTFAYGGRAILDRLSLDVPAGQFLGITGPTGSGKSTLLALLVALYEPPAGAVFLDGVDVRSIAPEVLRRHMALVLQHPYLFNRTLAENLAFARPDAARDETIEAAHVAGLDPDIRRFEQGLATPVGDRGVTLSGGQRLRVALGRALLARPRVLLLDDAFSAVDVHTEADIWDSLKKAMAGRTVVLVSHRISILRRCDRVAVIENGRVTEAGPHRELIDGGGFYARTFALQEIFEGPGPAAGAGGQAGAP
jgi:ATP-binding cassette, subfamily B, multidrug efflux pump